MQNIYSKLIFLTNIEAPHWGLQIISSMVQRPRQSSQIYILTYPEQFKLFQGRSKSGMGPRV